MHELEERVIATLLKDPKLLDTVDINASWFTDQRYREILSVMQNMDQAERTALNIYNELDHYEGMFGYRDLMALQDTVFSTANFANEIKSLRKIAVQKSLDEAVALYQMSPGKESLAKLSASIENLKKTDEEDDKGYLDGAMADLAYRMDHDAPVGIKSFEQLDEILAGGLYGSMLLTIGARPSVGKTAYSVNLAYQIIANDPDVQVDYFTLEMNKREMLNRFIARHTRISSQKLKRPAKYLQSYEAMIVNEAMQWYRDRKLRVYDKIITLSGILAVIRENAARAKPNKYIAIIDYIGLIKIENSRAQRWEQIGQISRELKIMANEYNVPIVVLAQLNRDVNANQKPQLSNLRESGSIEQDSNVVAFLHRPNEEERDLVRLTVQKNREGALGSIDYLFNGAYMEFKEIEGGG